MGLVSTQNCSTQERLNAILLNPRLSLFIPITVTTSVFNFQKIFSVLIPVFSYQFPSVFTSLLANSDSIIHRIYHRLTNNLSSTAKLLLFHRTHLPSPQRE